VIALALAGLTAVAGCAADRVASIRVVEGMPFVQPLRTSIRVERRRAPGGGFVILDGARPIAEIALAADGITVQGAVGSEAPHRVDVYAARTGCPAAPASTRRFDPQTGRIVP
jgi:hypothetical protein